MPLAKPYLVPIAVPWKIDTVPAFIPFCVKDANDVPEIVLRFRVYIDRDVSGIGESEDVYRGVEVTLPRCEYVKMYSDKNRRETEILNSFDWSRVPDFRDGYGSLIGSHQRWREAWKSSGICPDPSVYEVNESGLPIDALGEGMKHFVFRADEYVVEIVADRLDWRFV